MNESANSQESSRSVWLTFFFFGIGVVLPAHEMNAVWSELDLDWPYFAWMSIAGISGGIHGWLEARDTPVAGALGGSCIYIGALVLTNFYLGTVSSYHIVFAVLVGGFGAVPGFLVFFLLKTYLYNSSSISESDSSKGMKSDKFFGKPYGTSERAQTQPEELVTEENTREPSIKPSEPNYEASQERLSVNRGQYFLSSFVLLLAASLCIALTEYSRALGIGLGSTLQAMLILSSLTVALTSILMWIYLSWLRVSSWNVHRGLFVMLFVPGPNLLYIAAMFIKQGTVESNSAAPLIEKSLYTYIGATLAVCGFAAVTVVAEFEINNPDSCISGNCLEGYGIQELANSRYEGNFFNQYRHGDGKMIHDVGATYKGSWTMGRRDGQGVYQYEDGRRYEGEWENDSLEGQGKLFLVNGSRYEGEWVSGEIVSGKLFDIAGHRYEGEFKNRAFHGNGVFYHSNGAIYEGQFVDGKRSRGTEYYDRGDSFEGQFKDNKKHGHGTYYYAKGSFNRYVGQWELGKWNGKGTLYYRNGERLEGYWSDFKAHGRIKYNKDGGILYSGIYENGTAVNAPPLETTDFTATKISPGCLSARSELIKGRAMIEIADSRVDFLDAASYFRKAITNTLNQGSVCSEAYYNLAVALDKAGDFDKAVSAMRSYSYKVDVEERIKIRDELSVLEMKANRKKRKLGSNWKVSLGKGGRYKDSKRKKTVSTNTKRFGTLNGVVPERKINANSCAKNVFGFKNDYAPNYKVEFTHVSGDQWRGVNAVLFLDEKKLRWMLPFQRGDRLVYFFADAQKSGSRYVGKYWEFYGDFNSWKCRKDKADRWGSITFYR